MKIKKYLILLIIMLGSFYFIDQEETNLYREIKEKSKNNEIDYIDAVIKDKVIIPGKKGIKVDIEKTYRNMKKIGVYDETLTCFLEVSPSISISNIYDKYIEKGNPNKRELSLVFPIKNINHINKIIKILNNNKVIGNFFIDGKDLSEEEYLIRKNSNHFYNILNYNSTYDESLFRSSISFLKTIVKRKNLFCYTDNDNQNILDICSKMSLHTIKPSLIINNSLYKEVKDNINNSIIISIVDNSYNIKELDSTIKYIKSKGYKIVSLEDIISE